MFSINSILKLKLKNDFSVNKFQLIQCKCQVTFLGTFQSLRYLFAILLFSCLLFTFFSGWATHLLCGPWTLLLALHLLFSAFSCFYAIFSNEFKCLYSSDQRQRPDLSTYILFFLRSDFNFAN